MIGMKKKLNSSEKFFKIVKQINPYLLEAPDIVVEGLPKSLCDVFEMETGTRIGAQ